ncbi:MAG: hypothetical protein HOJ34_12125 [Kordiimonadaceae bacterium]|jgi:hypothetical protein|nr:hypothetical protein [Kordiimonadaceae bacterium]MBT6036434.1 hypothetical protein [Kordiimonadaceae bacterium]MBT6330517.1 hypothetical protein [Kordiimonadaceae bacterium]
MMSRKLSIIIFCFMFFSSFSNAAEQKIMIENEGWELYGDLGLADELNPKGIILMLHKASGNRSEYISMAEKANQAGFNSLRMDLRGHGESINLDSFDYLVKKNFELIEQARRDVAAAHNWIKADERFVDLPLIYMGASYSGEEMVSASEEVGFADAYIEMSPGSFSPQSIAKIDISGKPWFFVRAENELPFFPVLYENIRAGSTIAEIKVYPGEGHGTDLLKIRPEVEDFFLEWIENALNQ